MKGSREMITARCHPLYTHSSSTQRSRRGRGTGTSPSASPFLGLPPPVLGEHILPDHALAGGGGKKGKEELGQVAEAWLAGQVGSGERGQDAGQKTTFFDLGGHREVK